MFKMHKIILKAIFCVLLAIGLDNLYGLHNAATSPAPSPEPSTASSPECGNTLNILRHFDDLTSTLNENVKRSGRLPQSLHEETVHRSFLDHYLTISQGLRHEDYDDYDDNHGDEERPRFHIQTFPRRKAAGMVERINFILDKRDRILHGRQSLKDRLIRYCPKDCQAYLQSWSWVDALTNGSSGRALKGLISAVRREAMKLFQSAKDGRSALCALLC